MNFNDNHISDAGTVIAGAVRYMRGIIGCKYSQERRLEENYYDCSSAVARAFMAQGKQWPYNGPVPISCDLVYDDQLRLIWPENHDSIGKVMGGKEAVLKAAQPGDIQFICTELHTLRQNRITHVAMVLDERTIGHARGKAYGVCTNSIGKYAGQICAVARYDPTCELRRGMKGNRTAALQRELVSLGYDIAVDGDYGPVTEAAFRAMRKKARGQTGKTALIITGDTVNMRSGPDITSDIVHLARKHERYETVEGWLPAIFNGEVLWVSAKYAERYRTEV